MATTARRLGDYHRQLLSEGIDPEAAQQLVIEAARALLSRGELVTD